MMKLKNKLLSSLHDPMVQKNPVNLYPYVIHQRTDGGSSVGGGMRKG